MQFDSSYQEFINKRSYSRYIPEENRREEWWESVNRYGDFFLPLVPFHKKPAFEDAIKAFEAGEIVGSMRALWAAGPALKRDSTCGYNCAAILIDDPIAFAEVMHVLMCGGGIGFSVERQFIGKLPEVPKKIYPDHHKITFGDSRGGWVRGFYEYICELYKGHQLRCDYSQIRPKGARLKITGGQASGPEPLKVLIEATTQIFMGARGRKLNSIECYDLCCHIASVVVAGGVRRSATISFSNLSDQRMADAKVGEFWRNNRQRSLSNNSAAYTEKPEVGRFMEEWKTIMQSGSGERAIFNREATARLANKVGRREGFDFLSNPCGEIVLRPQQFCNLSEVIVRPDDTLTSLMAKVRNATILGVMQSTLTDFKFLRPEWRKNCEEERLLGVSLTGLRDHPILKKKCSQARIILTAMRNEARRTADEWADALGISQPKAITCVKPSGTVSQLMDCSSGLHARFAPYYTRRVGVSMKDPMAQFLIDHGIPWQPNEGEDITTCLTANFEFPIKSPEGAVCVKDVDAMEQLEYWKMLQDTWCDHRPSCTIYVKPDEWLRVGSWVYDNWDTVSGIAFFPADSGVYALPPYQEISREEYEVLAARMPNLDFTVLNQYEVGDNTTGAREAACSGGACEI